MRDRLIRRPEVSDKTGLSRSKLYALISTGEFPKQISIGANAAAWLESEVDGWIAARVAERDQQQDHRHSRSHTSKRLQTCRVMASLDESTA